MTDERSAHDVWVAFSKQEPHLFEAHRLAVALRRLHDCRVAGADPDLTDDQWSTLTDTLLDRLQIETAAALDAFREAQPGNGRRLSRLKSV